MPDEIELEDEFMKCTWDPRSMQRGEMRQMAGLCYQSTLYKVRRWIVF